jgi:protein tyrosine/serine phosphatase
MTGIDRTFWGRKKVAQRATIVFFQCALAIGAYYGTLQYEGNFHEVVPGQFYRSAQIDKSELEAVIRSYGIRSILNLRGANRGKAWYEDEITTSNAFGIAHFDYGISARRVVRTDQIAAILDIVRTAPKPILVHCSAGADRTGLISALYLVKVEGISVEIADKQLSLVYGHFPYLTSKTVAMDESFWRYIAGENSAR